MGAKYTDEMHKSLSASFIKSGMTVREYSRAHGVCMKTVNRALKKYPVPPTIKNHASGCVARSVGHTVLVIPDMHCPFEHPDALAFLKAVKAKFQPTKIVCLGDEVDFHAFSRYPKDPDGMSPGQELAKSKEALIPFYREFPEVEVCTSNHTVRPLKQMFQQGLPEAMYPTYSTLLNAPDGWQWKDRIEIDGVLYIHGEGRSGQNAHTQFMKAYKKSVVIGHIHSYAGVNYEGTHFAMNTGCLIDTRGYAFKYAKSMPIPVNLGCGLVFGGRAAHFMPMHTDKNNRWIGRL